MKIDCPVSVGELVDKISILRIKLVMIKDEEKIKNVKHEEALLTSKLELLKLSKIDSYLQELININTSLWKIEDDIRDMEREQNFSEEFIKLARSVYITNDKRFEVKDAINSQYGSDVVEVKSYKDY